MHPFRTFVHPLCTEERQDDTFWDTPMKCACYVCGQIPFHYINHSSIQSKSNYETLKMFRPYPLLSFLDATKNELVAFEVVCATCFRNYPKMHEKTQFNETKVVTWNSLFVTTILKFHPMHTRVFPEEKSEEEEKQKELEHDSIHLFDTTCPWESLSLFGGPVPYLDYLDPDFVYSYPTTQNPFHQMKFTPTHPYWNPATRLTLSLPTICCWECKQPIPANEFALPICWEYDASGPEVIYKKTTGVFHASGRCALRYILSFPGFNERHRYVYTLKMWQLHFHLKDLFPQCTLRPAPPRRFLQSMQGWMTSAEFEQETLNIYLWREKRSRTYPLFVSPATTQQPVSSRVSLEEIKDSCEYLIQPNYHLLHMTFRSEVTCSTGWRIYLDIMSFPWYDVSRLSLPSKPSPFHLAYFSSCK